MRVPLVILMLFALGGSAVADRWSDPFWPLEYASANGKYTLKVTLARKVNAAAGAPQPAGAELLMTMPPSSTSDKATPAVVWKLDLPHQTAPVRAFVADTGKYAVTFDEWYHVGELPVVILSSDGTGGGGGKVVKRFTLDELLSLRDLANVLETTTSKWWSRDAVAFFNADDSVFLIRLHWGKLLAIDLRAGKLIDKTDARWNDLEAFAGRKVRELALKMVASKVEPQSLPVDTNDRRTGALLCGQLKLREAIPALRELLKDESHHTTSRQQGKYLTLYPVRQAAADALKSMGEPIGAVVIETEEK